MKSNHPVLRSLRRSQGLVKTARKLECLGRAIDDCVSIVLKRVSKTKYNNEEFHSNIVPAIALLMESYSYFRSINCLVKNRRGLDAMVLLRPQLESTLMMMYMIEKGISKVEMYRRAAMLEDWIAVKANNNSTRSKMLSMVSRLSQFPKYLLKIQKLKLRISKQYGGKIPGWLDDSASFLKDKASVAEKNGILDVYQHVYVESSASIHVADLFDRIVRDRKNPGEYKFYLQDREHCIWPTLMAILVMTSAARAISDRLGISEKIGETILIAADRSMLARQKSKLN